MENEEVIAQLKTLTETEARILYLKCSGFDYEDIGLQIHYEIPTVQLYASSMYQKLGFDKKMHSSQRKKILEKDYCPVIVRLFDQEQGWLPDEPEPNPTFNALMVVQQEYRDEQDRRLTKRSPQQVVVIDQDKAPNKKNEYLQPVLPPPQQINHPWGLYVIIAILIAAVVYLFLQKSPPAQSLPVPTPLPTYTLFPTYTIPVAVIAPTATIEPTIKATEIPTDSPTITWTPRPTQEVLVETNFIKDGIGPWNVVGPYIIQQEGPEPGITSDGSGAVTMTIGDESWKNYEVFAHFTHFDTGSCDFYFGVRINNEGKGMLLGVVRAARLGWFKNIWSYDGWIKNNEALITDPAPTLDIKVTGDSFNWVGYDSISLTGYPSGGIQIHLTCDKMDYIKIIKLP